jgi:hypothetical protein
MSPNMGECFQIIPRPNIDKHRNKYCNQFGAQRQISTLFVAVLHIDCESPRPLAKLSDPFCYIHSSLRANFLVARDVAGSLLPLWYQLPDSVMSTPANALLSCSEVKSHLGSHLLTAVTRLYTQHTNRHPEVASSNTVGEGDGCKGKQDL